MRMNFTRLFVALLMLSTASLSAQISITADNMPNITTAQESCTVGAPADFNLGAPSMEPQSWDLTGLADTGLANIAFIPVEGTDADDIFVDSEFARNSPLSSLLGIDITQILPLELDNATAYYSTGADGEVLIDGVSTPDVYISALDITIPLAVLPADPAYEFWAPGEFGDSYNKVGQFLLTTPVPDNLPLPPGNLVVAFVDFSTDVAVDAYGDMTLPGGANLDVLRYNEVSTVSALVNIGTPNGDGTFNFLFPEALVDTTVVTTTDRYYSDQEDYPIATINTSVFDGEVVVNSIEYLKLCAPDVIELTVTSDPQELDCETNCLNILLDVTGTDSEVSFSSVPPLDIINGAALVCPTESTSYTITATSENDCGVSTDNLIFDVIVPECNDTICEANAGALAATEAFACGGAVTLSSTGANEEYALIYIMTDTDLNIMDLNTSGDFSGLAMGDYLPHCLSIKVEDVPADPGALVGANAADVLATLDCFDLFTGDAIVSLNPIAINVEYDCDEDAGTYTLTVSFTGGLPAYDNAQLYTLTGFSLGGTQAIGEQTVLEFAENDAYEIAASDDSGCASAVDADTPEPCTKTAIELLSFNGRTDGANNLLMWETATEENNARFEIHRSVDGTDFELVGTQEGAGNSTIQHAYTFIDAEVKMTYYYQLVSVSFDGETQKSNVISVERKGDFVVNDVYPNPVSSILNIDIASLADGAATVSIHSIGGALVSTQQIELREGVQTYPLDVTSLAGGVYLLRLTDGAAVFHQKITVK